MTMWYVYCKILRCASVRSFVHSPLPHMQIRPSNAHTLHMSTHLVVQRLLQHCATSTSSDDNLTAAASFSVRLVFSRGIVVGARARSALIARRHVEPERGAPLGTGDGACRSAEGPDLAHKRDGAVRRASASVLAYETPSIACSSLTLLLVSASTDLNDCSLLLLPLLLPLLLDLFDAFAENKPKAPRRKRLPNDRRDFCEVG